MYKFIFMLICSVLLTSCSSMQTHKELTLKEYNIGLNEGEEPILYPLTIRGIKKIIIQGKSQHKECRKFTLTQSQITQYLQFANTITSDSYHHTIDWSPCHIFGKVIFDNNESAQWFIQQYKSGTMTFNTGKTIYLYCPSCDEQIFNPADIITK